MSMHAIGIQCLRLGLHVAHGMLAGLQCAIVTDFRPVMHWLHCLRSSKLALSRAGEPGLHICCAGPNTNRW